MASVEPPTPPVADLPQSGPASSKDARTFAMLCHLVALCGYVIPFGNIVGPLVIWLMKKDEFPLVDDQGKESLNFQITMTLATVAALLSVCIGIGVVLIPAVLIVELVFIVIATIRANSGEAYRYPFCLRLIK